MSLQATQKVSLAAACLPMKQHGVAVSGSSDVFESLAAGLKGLSVDLKNVHCCLPGILHNGLPERIGYPRQEVHVHDISLGTTPT